MTEPQIFTPVELIGNLIQENVPDLIPDRKRWVYPTFSIDDSKLPQCTVKMVTNSYTTDSAGDYMSEEMDGENNIFKEYFYKKATAKINLYILTQKRQEFTVENNGTELFLTNQPLNLYITNNVKEALWRGFNVGYFQNQLERVNILNVDSAFRDTETIWASEIQCEVKYKDVWVKEYKDGVLVKEYSLTANKINILTEE
jgi:hypothetical protein